MSGLGHAAVSSMRKRLESAFQRASASAVADDTRADLARYLCVRISGFVERSLIELLASYCDRKTDPRTARYLGVFIDRTTNVDATKLAAILDQFDVAWGEKMRRFFDVDDEAREALNSVIAKRHLIAHGHDDGTGLATIRQWFGAVDRAVKA